MRHPRGRRRLRRTHAVAQAAPSRLRGRALLREGWRRRRYLVLEPVPGHRLRRRELQLPTAARGDGVLPDDAVRIGFRNPRVLPVDGDPVRLLRQGALPHDRREDRLGRGHPALDCPHRSWRRHAGPPRDPGQRHPHQPPPGPDRRHGDLRRRIVPHLALALRHRPDRQARRHHRYRCNCRASGARAGQGRR